MQARAALAREVVRASGTHSASMSSASDTASPLRAVLLDIDGTLLASNASHAAAWSDACAEFGFVRDAAFFEPLIGMGGDRVLPLVDASLDDSGGVGERIAERRKAIYTETYFPEVEPTRGARALVQRFHDEGWRCVVATSSSSEELSASLERVGIAGLIDAASKHDDAESSKPDPGIVEAALKKAGLEPSQALLIGDTPFDIQAATAARVLSVALLTGGWKNDALSGAAAIYADPQAFSEAFDWKRRTL